MFPRILNIIYMLRIPKFISYRELIFYKSKSKIVIQPKLGVTISCFSHQVMMPSCLIWTPRSHFWHLFFPPHPSPHILHQVLSSSALKFILYPPIPFLSLETISSHSLNSTIAFLLVLTLLWLLTHFLCTAVSF